MDMADEIMIYHIPKDILDTTNEIQGIECVSLTESSSVIGVDICTSNILRFDTKTGQNTDSSAHAKAEFDIDSLQNKRSIPYNKAANAIVELIQPEQNCITAHDVPERPYFMHAIDILTSIFNHYIDVAKESYAMNNSENAFNCSILEALGDAISFGVPTHAEYTHDDVGLLSLYQSDFPVFAQVSDIFFKIGNPLPLPEDAWYALDIHLPFCRLLLQTYQEVMDPHIDFPCMVKSSKLIFEDEVGAKEYYRRAWRYQSENQVPMASVPQMAPCYTTSNLHTRLRNPSVFLSAKIIQNIPEMANVDSCRVFRRSRQDTTDAQNVSHAVTELSDVLLIICRQGCVVHKVQVQFRDTGIPHPDPIAGYNTCIPRIQYPHTPDIILVYPGYNNRIRRI